MASDDDPRNADPANFFSVREITRQIEVPWQLEIDVSVHTPQALLRDLHRPVKGFELNEMEIERLEFTLDGGRAEMRAMKKTAFADYRIRIWEMIPTEKLWRDAWADYKGTMKLPWAEAAAGQKPPPKNEPGSGD